MFDQLEEVVVTRFNRDDLLVVLIAFVVAWVIHLLARRLARRVVRIQTFASGDRTAPARQAALQGLVAGLISFAAIVIAVLVSLSRVVDAATLVWVVGLFSAAFGLGARPLVSDFLSGMSFIFEDAFGVGEKVEMPIPGSTTVEGIIEEVNLRTTLVRATSGELYTVPNGEIRVVRNFSRGQFSRADVTLRVHAHDVERALNLLEALADEAPSLLPHLLEPWHVIAASSALGQSVELTLLAKARFGQAAVMRPRLVALVESRFREEGIDLVG